jgi:hypothetical protein
MTSYITFLSERYYVSNLKSRADEPRAESMSLLNGYAEAMDALNRRLRADETS